MGFLGIFNFFGTAECDFSGLRYRLSGCLLNVGEMPESERMLLSDECPLSECLSDGMMPLERMISREV